MTSNRPILCATDFSPHAERAASLAADLARVLGAPLELVHVMDTGADAETTVNEVGRALRERVTKRVSEAADGLANEASALGSLACETRVLDGRPSEALAAHAEAIDARFVVVGAHGATRALAKVRDLVLGSTAERVLRMAKRPVLVAPALATNVVLGTAPWVVGVALDHAAAHTLDVAFALAAHTKTALNAIHVVPVDEPDERAATKHFDHEVMSAERRQKLTHEPQTWVVRGVVAEMLVGMAKDVNGVLVIGTHAPGVIERLTLGSVAARALQIAEGPVLVVPPPR